MPNEIDSLRSVLATFTARRAVLTAALDRVNSTIVTIEEELAQTKPVLAATPATEQTISGYAPARRAPMGTIIGIYSRMAVGVAAIHFLKSNGGSQTTVAIVEALKAGGQRTKTKNWYRLVYNTLAARSKRANPDVKKDGHGWTYVPPKSDE